MGAKFKCYQPFVSACRVGRYGRDNLYAQSERTISYLAVEIGAHTRELIAPFDC
jgi:hypothetical protein